MSTRVPPLDSLGESRERYRVLFESNMLGIATSDLDEQIIEANDAFLTLVGYSRRDLETGRLTWSAITPNKYDELDQKKIRELLKRGTITPFEKEYVHKKGHLVPVLVGAAAVNIHPSLSVCFALEIGEMKKLEKKKDEFIGTVSHELKTPLAVMKMQASLLRDQVKSGMAPEVVERSIADIDGQIGRLTVLITDLLNLARHTSESAFFHAKVFDMQACVAKVVGEIRLITKRRIHFRRAKRKCLVNGNEDRISQVLINLLVNAIRYSPTDTDIVVRVGAGPKFVRVFVQDFGIGINKRNLKKIFERNYRVNHSAQYAEQASGIGLHISREIMQHHRGTIAVVSKEGKGSTFCCTLPLFNK